MFIPCENFFDVIFFTQAVVINIKTKTKQKKTLTIFVSEFSHHKILKLKMHFCNSYECKFKELAVRISLWEITIFCVFTQPLRHV